MKKNITIFLIASINALFAQKFIQSNGCVKMYSNSYITSDGASYSAWLENQCKDPVYVGQSEYKIVFKMTDKNGKSKMFGTNRDLDFPAIFIKPGTNIYSDKNKRDYSSGTTYDEIRRESGTIGETYNLSFSEISGFSKDMELTLNTPLLIGQNNGVNFYATLSSFDGWLDKNYGNFERFLVKITAENTKKEKDNNKYNIDFEMAFCGVIFGGNVSIQNLKAGEVFSKEETFKFRSNLEYIRVYFRNTSLSDVKQSLTYSNSKVKELLSSNLLIEQYISHMEAANAEGSKTQAAEIKNHIYNKFPNSTYVLFEKGKSSNISDTSIKYLKKYLEVEKSKTQSFYEANFLLGLQYMSKGDNLWKEKSYEKADKSYKTSLNYIIAVEPLLKIAPDNANTYNSALALAKSNAEKFTNEQQKIKQEAENNKKLFASNIAEGDDFMKSKDYKNAIEKYENALNLNVNNKLIEPKLNNARTLNAAAVKKENEEKEKRENFEKLIKEGNDKISEKDFSSAKTIFTKALSSGVDNKQAQERITFLETTEKSFKEYGSRFGFIEVKQHEASAKNKYYATVNLFGQTWFVNTLRATKASDDKRLDYVEKAWYYSKLGKVKRNSEAPGYYSPENSYSDSTKGKLYDYQSAKLEPSICPEGWHVPSVKEWMKFLKESGATMKDSTKYRIVFQHPNKNRYDYDKEFMNASLNDILGFGVKKSNNYIVDGKLENYNAKFWALNFDKDPYCVTFIKSDNKIEITITYLFDKEYQALECKCLKD